MACVEKAIPKGIMELKINENRIIRRNCVKIEVIRKISFSEIFQSMINAGLSDFLLLIWHLSQTDKKLLSHIKLWLPF